MVQAAAEALQIALGDLTCAVQPGPDRVGSDDKHCVVCGSQSLKNDWSSRRHQIPLYDLHASKTIEVSDRICQECSAAHGTSEVRVRAASICIHGATRNEATQFAQRLSLSLSVPVAIISPPPKKRPLPPLRLRLIRGFDTPVVEFTLDRVALDCEDAPPPPPPGPLENAQPPSSFPPPRRQTRR